MFTDLLSKNLALKNDKTHSETENDKVKSDSAKDFVEKYLKNILNIQFSRLTLMRNTKERRIVFIYQNKHQSSCMMQTH